MKNSHVIFAAIIAVLSINILCIKASESDTSKIGYVKNKVKMAGFTSNLPIVLINTKGKSIVDEPKINAEMKIIYNGTDEMNSIDDQTYDYNGMIGIELRGNSTQGFPKKPYSVETRDADGNNLNVEILGMPAENDWVFRASWLDRTFIRNPLAHHLSRETGEWSSRFRHCELFLNNKYQGIYIILEKIKRDKNRLDLAELNPDELEGEDITGGYIYEITGFHDDFGNNRRIKYPKPNNIHNLQLNYIRDYDDGFREMMEKDGWNDEQTGYSQWIDVYSFVHEMIVQEAMRNSDAFGWSAYFHKDKNGPICAGPVWDFDQSSGNSSYKEGYETTGWLVEMWSNPSPLFWQKLFSDDIFKGLLKYRWFQLRKRDFSNQSVYFFIDSIANYLGGAQIRNFSTWNILGQELWRDTPGWEFRYSYDQYVQYLNSYINDRFKWLDGQMQSFPTIIENEENRISNGNLISSVYPNPAGSILYLDISSNTPGAVSVKLTNLSGQYIQGFELDDFYRDKSVWALDMESLPKGVYFVQVTFDGKESTTHKVVKVD